VECGYTEAVMHFTFDNITLPIPHAVSWFYPPSLVTSNQLPQISQVARWKTALKTTPKSNTFLIVYAANAHS
jgi:hypothetical protein